MQTGDTKNQKRPLGRPRRNLEPEVPTLVLLPESIREALEEKVREDGGSMKAVIVAALRSYLGVQD